MYESYTNNITKKTQLSQKNNNNQINDNNNNLNNISITNNIQNFPEYNFPPSLYKNYSYPPNPYFNTSFCNYNNNNSMNPQNSFLCVNNNSNNFKFLKNLN